MESDEELDFGEDEFIVPQQAVEPAPAPTLTPKATLDPLPAAAPTLKPTTASSDPSTQPASSRENGAASSSTIPTQPARPRSTDADRFAPSARTQDRYAIENRSRDRRDNGADSTRSPRPAPSRSRANSRANSPNRRPSPASRSAQPSRQPCPQPAPRTRSPTPPPQPKPPHNPRLDVSGRELPQDWESRISASQGDMYYKNVMTGESSWTIPEQAAQTKEMPEPTKEQPQQQEQEQEQPLPPSPVKKITVHPDRARLVTPLEPQSTTAATTKAGRLASKIEGSTVSGTEDPDSRTDTRWAKGPVSPASARSVEQSRKSLPPQQGIFPTGPSGRERGPRSGRPERGAAGLSNANLVAVAPRRPSSSEAIPTGPKALAEIPTGPRGPVDAPTGPRGNKWASSASDVTSKRVQPGGARPVPPPPPPPSAPAADRRAFPAREAQDVGSAGMKRVSSANPSVAAEAGPRFAPTPPADNRWAAPVARRDAPKPFAPPTAPRAIAGRGGRLAPLDAKDLDASLESYVAARSPGSQDDDYRHEPPPVAKEPEPVVAEKAAPAPVVAERQSLRDLPPHQQPAAERRRLSVSPPRALPPHLRNALPRGRRTSPSRARPRSPPRERSPPPSNNRSPPPHLARQRSRSPPKTSATIAAVESGAAAAGASTNQWGPRAARALADRKEREERTSDRRDRDASSSDRRDREISSSDRRDRDDGDSRRSRDRDSLPPRRRSPSPPPRRRSRSPRRRGDEYAGRDRDAGKPRRDSYTIREGPRFDVDTGRRVLDSYRHPQSPPRRTEGGMANGLRGRFRVPDEPSSLDARRSPPLLSPPSRSSGLPPSYLLPANPTNQRRQRSLSPPLRIGAATPAGTLPVRPRQRSRSRSPGRGGMEGAKSVERSVQERADEMPLLRFGKSSGPAVVGVLASEESGNAGNSLAARLSSLPDRPTSGNSLSIKRSHDSIEPERRRDDGDDRAREREGNSEDWEGDDGGRSRNEGGLKRRRPGGRSGSGRKR